MENTNYAQILSERILALRKEKGLTQEALAAQMGVSFQAVSKWENGQSCPDIALLPLLSDIFEVPIDSLFGRQSTPPPAEPPPIAEPVFAYCDALPWPDDQTLRGVVAWGHKILQRETMPRKLFSFNTSQPEYTWLLRYSPLNVSTNCSLHVEGDVHGKVAAGSSITCGNIDGSAAAGSHIECGQISGSASAGSHITCSSIGGDAKAAKVTVNTGK